MPIDPTASRKSLRLGLFERRSVSSPIFAIEEGLNSHLKRIVIATAKGSCIHDDPIQCVSRLPEVDRALS
jgi:hypothetical protein